MVNIREDKPILADGSVDIDGWIAHIAATVSLRNPDQLKCASEMVQDAMTRQEAMAQDKKLLDSFRIGLDIVQILAELQLDQTALEAGLFYVAVREGHLTREAVEGRFGKSVARLLSGVLKMAAIGSLHHPIRGVVLGQGQAQVDNVRKMLVAMIDDVRVALIKIAERTCTIRNVYGEPPEVRHRVAREVFDIYAPLAHRLGVGHLKWELEDLSFRYLHGTAYKKIAKLLDERRVDRERYIAQTLDALGRELDQAGIQAELSGRAKHIYSIWRKMHRKNIDFAQVYDIRAVRILVNEVRDCYAALGIVHSLWRHIPHEFDDYIATPKENGYRSLHTAVIGPDGRFIEIQIRTHAMHEEAELGVCSHWRYKGTDAKQQTSSSYEDKIAWLRQVLEWHDDLGGVESLADHLAHDITSDRVYIFTPKGHVVDLPQGATPLDFAFRVHTEIGLSCRGAKVNGRIVPLSHTLHTGEQVTILRNKTLKPSRDWLNPNLGYLQTSRARAKVQNWFRLQDRESNCEAGKQMVTAELRRLSLESVRLDTIAGELNFPAIDDMYAAVGAGDLKVSQVVGAWQRLSEPEGLQLFRRRKPVESDQGGADAQGDVMIQGVGTLLTSIASCCKPVPGDPIIGYITVGRGVSIHQQNCPNIAHLRDFEPGRVVEVSWGIKTEKNYPVDIQVIAYDRSGLLRDISAVLANERINVRAVRTKSSKRNEMARMKLTLEIPDLGVLGGVLEKINRIPNVIEVARHRQRS